MRYIALFVVLGLLLGIGLSQMSNAGYFERWRETAPAPVRLEELVTGGKGTIYARSTDGEVYRCTLWRGECWVADDVPSFAGDPYPSLVTRPCDQSSPEFFLIAGPPQEIVDCLHEQTTYADGWGESSYVLDAQGVVWEWEHGGTVYSAGGGGILGSCLGMLAGLALGSGMVWWKRRRAAKGAHHVEHG